MDSAQMYRAYQNQAAAAYSSLYFSFFFLSNFQTLTFSSHFSQELWDLEDWNSAHMWTVDIRIVYTVFRLLLLICHFISSFFFHCNFQTFKFFVTLFSETVWPRKLKLGTHMDSEQMHRVYQNQAAAPYSSLYFSFFFLSNFQTLNFFITLFSGTWRLKLGTHKDSGQMYCVYRNQAAAAYLSLVSSFFFLSVFIFFCFSSFQFMICLSPQIAL